MNTTDVELDWEKLPWVNQTEVDIESRGDMLATIFAGQRLLMQKYEEIERRNGCVVVREQYFGAIDDRQVQMRIKDLGFRVVEELTEATNCLKNKPWKDTFVATDVEHFYEELADALHFFVELCITAGLSPEDLFKLYFRKHAVNQFRQESKY